MTQVVRHAAAVRRSPRLFRFVRVRLSRKLWGTYRITLRNIVSSTLGWMLVGIGLSADLPARAAPVGGQVAVGQVQISAPTPQLTLVNQASQKAVINWQSFGIAGNETVKIVQPSASSVLLNRIVGGDPSKIYGALTANGQVFLVNPQGVYFAPDARVDTGALVASTLALSNADFSAGSYRFGGAGSDSGAGRVVNDGRISVAPGGYVVLAAPQVGNNGTISAAGGTVALLAGARVSIDTAGGGLVSYSVDAAALHAHVGNAGSLLAEGGAVVLLANAAANTAGSALVTAVNHSGVIRANSVVEHQGIVTLRAIGGDTVVAGSIDVSAAPNAGEAPGQTGGTVAVLGRHVDLIEHASIRANGAVGGGTVLIGGAEHGQGGVPTASQTTVGADVRISANAGRSGAGGTVIVWADGHTVFNGAIEARGGAAGGHGGFVETSGQDTLVFNGTVDTRAPHGQTGTLLLDPKDITISSNPASASASTSNVNTTDLQSQLASNAVIVNTEAAMGVGAGSGVGTIHVNDPVTWAASNSLTLKATTTLALNAAVTNTGSGALALLAGDAVTLNANVALAGGAFSVTGAGGAGTRSASFTAAPGTSIRTGGGAVHVATTGALLTQAIDTSGATVSAGAGLDAGAVTLDSSLGSVSLQGAITATGSNAFAGSGLGGGAGGRISVTGSSGVRIASATTIGGLGDGAGNPGSGGNVTLAGGSGDVTQTPGSVIQTGTLSASTSGATAAVTLDQANQIDRLGAVTANGAITLNNAAVNGLTLSAAVTTNGQAPVSITNAGGNLTLGSGGSVAGASITLATTSSGQLALGAAVDGNAGAVTLTSAQDISQTPAGTIHTGGALVLSAGGAITLDAANTLTSLGEVTRGGAFVLNNTGGDLTLSGAITAGTTRNAVRIATAGGALILGSHAITATTTAGSVTLTGDGVSQTSGTLTVGGVTQVNAGAGSIDLQAPTNDFTGAVTLNSSGAMAAVRAVGNLTLAAPTLGVNTGLLAVAGLSLTLPVAAIQTGSGAIELRSDAGPLTTAGALTTSSGTIRLVGALGLDVADALTTTSGSIALVGGATGVSGVSGVGVSVHSAVRVDAGNAMLSLDGGGAAIALNASTLTTTNASAAALTLRNATRLTLGNLSTGSGGITSLDANAAVTQTDGTAIHTGTLTARAGGSLVLTQANQIDTLGAVTADGGFTLNNAAAGGLTVNAAVTTNGMAPIAITNDGGDLKLASGGSVAGSAITLATSSAGQLALAGPVDGKLGAVTLTSAQNISQTSAGAIHTGGTLTVTAGGTVQLDQSNTVAALGAGSSNGAFTFNNTGADLHVAGAITTAGNGMVQLTNAGGSLSLDSGASVSGAGVQLGTASAHDIVLAGAVDGGNASVGFSSGADIRQSAAGTIHTRAVLSVSAAGSVRLDAANSVGSLGDVTVAGGELTFNNLGALNVVGAVTAPGAVRLTSAGGDLTLGSGGGLIGSGRISGAGVTLTTAAGHNITLGGRVDGNAGDVTLVSGHDISETATGAINTTGALLLSAGGSITLAQANTITTLGDVTRGGAFSLNDASGGLTLAGSVSAGATNNTVRITTSGGALALGSHDVTATTAAGNVTLAGDGVSQTTGTVTAGGTTTVNAATGSIDLQSATNDFNGAVTLSSSGAGVAVRAAGGLTLAAVQLGANTALTAIAAGTLSLPMGSIHTGSGAIELRSDGGPLAAPGELATTSGAITLVGAHGLTVAHDLSSVSGNVALTGGGSGGLVVNSAVRVDAGNALIAVNGGGGVIALNDSTLTSTNNSAAATTLRNASGVVLGNVVTGATGTTTLGVGADISGAVTQTAGTAISTGTLLLSTAGAITLDQSNAVANLGAVRRGGAFSLNDAIGDLTLTGSVSAGVTNNAVTLTTTGGALALGAFDVTATNITLAGGGVSQTTGAITAGGTTTVMAGSGSIDLQSVSNAFTGAVTLNSSGEVAALRAANHLNLAAPTLGANTGLSAVAGGALSLPTVAIHTGNGAIVLRSDGGALVTQGELVTTNGAITLVGAQGLTVANALTTTGAAIALTGGGSGGVVVNNGVSIDAGNALIAIDGGGGGAAIVLNNSRLTTTNNSAAAITLRNASGVVLGNLGTGATGTTTLGVGADISGAVTQTAGTAITTGTLLLSTAGAITLDQANAIANLGAVTRGGAFALNDAIGGLSLTGSVSTGATNNAVTLTTSGGALALGAFDVTATNVTLAGGGVSQTTGAISAGGTTIVNAGAGSIDLQAALNRFTGAVNTTGANIALATGGSGMVLGTTTASGALNVNSRGGAITETGVAHISGVATLTAAGDITLGTAGNRFGGVVNTRGANVTLVAGSGGSSSLQLGVTMATGALHVTQLGGAILETGAATVGDTSSFVATTAPGGAVADITLGAAANRFGGAVSSSGANVTLAAGSGLVLGNTAASNLVVTDTGGAVAGTGALLIAGSTRVSSTTDAVTLTNAGNDFAGIVTASAATEIAVGASRNLTIALSAGGNASVSALAGNLVVTGRSGAALTTTSGGTTGFGAAGSTALSLSTSAGGDVSQTGAVTIANAASVTSTRGAITLANAGNGFGGTVAVTTTAPGQDITLVNRSDLSVALRAGGNADLTALNGQLGVSGTTGAALKTHSAGTTNFGLTHVGTTLMTTAVGDVQQSAALTVAGAANVMSAAGSIALGNVGNDFGGAVTAVAATAGQGITLVDRGDLDVAVTAGASVHLTALAGRLDVSGSTGAGLTTVSGTATSFGVTHVATTLNASAGTDMAQTGALSVGGTAVVTSSGGTVMLTNAGNDFVQVVSASAGQDLAIAARGDLNLVLTAGGNAAVTATGNAVVSGQTGAALSTVSGAATAFGATTVGAGLSTTAAGNVSQSGAVGVAGTTAITATAGSVMLATAANRFVGEAVFNAGELTFQTSQNAVVQIKAVTGNASITTGGNVITLNGGYFNGPTLKLTSLNAPSSTGVVLRKEADRPYFQLGEGMQSVSTALAAQQDLVAFFNGSYPKTLVDGVPYAALQQFRLLSGSAMAAELAEQERRERERSAGVGRLKEAIRLNTVTYDEIVAPLSYTTFEVLNAPCAKAQATGKLQCE